MFRLPPPDRTYSVPVDIEVPEADGEVGTARIACSFRLLPDSRINELAAESYGALLREVVADWSHVHGQDGEPLPCSGPNLAALCDVPYWRRSVANAYLRWAAGLPAKNSKAPPGAG